MIVSVEITEEPLRFVTRGLKSRLSVELSAIVDDKKLARVGRNACGSDIVVAANHGRWHSDAREKLPT